MEKQITDYGWHDLRSKPDDMPPAYTEVLIMIKVGADYAYQLASWSGSAWTMDMEVFEDKPVLAWHKLPTPPITL